MRKILIIDDSNLIRILVKAILEKNDEYEVLVAANGKEGLNQLVIHEDIELIFLDVMMPDMDGFEFLKKSKPLKLEREIKICMLSAVGQETKIKEALKFGADDYLVKPIDNDLLNDKARIHLKDSIDCIFKQMNSNVQGELLTPGKPIDITITNIFENGLDFTTTTELPINVKVFVKSEDLLGTLGEKNPLLVNIYEGKKDGKTFTYKTTFIGFKGELYKEIRRLTTTHEDFDPNKNNLNEQEDV